MYFRGGGRSYRLSRMTLDCFFERVKTEYTKNGEAPTL